MDHTNTVLSMRHISKSFPGVKALDDVSIDIKAGTVHAVMGENGAGKSTLMKCAFGLYHPDEGEILIDGAPCQLAGSRDAMDKGISMIHQELHPIRTRNVMENIWVGRVPVKKVLGVQWVDDERMYKKTKELLDDLKIDIDPKAMMSELSVAYCQMVEIVRAVSYNARVIIMDEPTSSLTEKEAELLFAIIRLLTAQGTAILYISHKIDEILEISDEVSIMRDGQMMSTWPASELTQDDIIKRMVGREMTTRFPERNNTPGAEYLRVEGLTSANPHSFRDISFAVRRGEIFGIGGLVGAQRTELLEAIFGLRHTVGGQVFIEGNPVCIRRPQDAIQLGMALLTEERRATGIVPMLSVMENTVLANQTAHVREYTGGRLFLSEKKRRADAQEYVKALSVKTTDIKTQIQYLSGGNQQKVLLGRWLLTQPNVLILDEPTRGIDIGAKYEIYTFMQKLAGDGKCVIMISSEMPELIGMSDRIMVMCEGRLSGILESKDTTDEKIMALASAYQGEQGVG